MSVEPDRQQVLGVRTGTVELRPVSAEIRAVGRVAFDETRLEDVTVKYGGYIGRLHVEQTGQAVRRGQTLFTLYSPELYAAQHGKYPENLDELTRVDAAGQSLLVELPLDPWKNPYVYEPPLTPDSRFRILSYGADGAPGGEGARFYRVVRE